MNRKTLLLIVCSLVLFLSVPLASMANSIATLEQVAPIPTTYGLVNDFYPFQYTAIGDVTAPLVDSVGLGGNASDFAGFPVGAIALIERGTYTFQLKVANAAAAGAVGAIIYDGTLQDDAIRGTLIALSPIPALFVTRDVGLDLVSQTQAGGVFIHMATYTSDPPPITQAPEPTTMLLFGFGLLGLVGLKRKLKA